MSRSVLLGSLIELHAGIHDSLVRSPPNGLRYMRRPARHVFLGPHDRNARAFDPLGSLHWGELVDFGPGRELVHSARWPVLNRRRWIADLDDFGYVCLVGRAAASASCRRRLARPWTRGVERDVRRRLAFMLTAFAHESCHGIVYRSTAALRDAERWLAAFGVNALADSYLAKCVVVHPAERAIGREAAEGKWHDALSLKLLFVGRDAVAKRGAVALRAFELARAKAVPVTLTYVGPLSDRAVAHARRSAGFEHISQTTRAEVLRLMSTHHVLLHPAHEESVGMVFVEAAASAMVVVASASDGVSAIGELLPAAGVERIPVQLGDPDAEAAAIARTIARWCRVEGRSMARARAFANWRAAMTGCISVARRSRLLGSLYERAWTGKAGAPLSIAALALDVVPETDEWSSARLRRREREEVRMGRTVLHFSLGQGAAQ